MFTCSTPLDCCSSSSQAVSFSWLTEIGLTFMVKIIVATPAVESGGCLQEGLWDMYMPNQEAAPAVQRRHSLLSLFRCSCFRNRTRIVFFSFEKSFQFGQIATTQVSPHSHIRTLCQNTPWPVAHSSAVKAVAAYSSSGVKHWCKGAALASQSSQLFVKNHNPSSVKIFSLRGDSCLAPRPGCKRFLLLLTS